MKIGLWFAAVWTYQTKFNKKVNDFNCLFWNQDIIKNKTVKRAMDVNFLVLGKNCSVMEIISHNYFIYIYLLYIYIYLYLLMNGIP